ncbi:hypothetical protein [Paracoccus yeei]|nr:hypothetical protein [Paracoccus yeei]
MIRIISSTETIDGFGCRYRVARHKCVLLGRWTLLTLTTWGRS